MASSIGVLNTDCAGELLSRASIAQSEDELRATITATLEHPNIYFFGEFLQIPSVETFTKRVVETQSINDHHREAWLLLLLAFGTVQDLAVFCHKGIVPLSAVNSHIIRKLQKLTVTSLCLNKRILDLDEIVNELRPLPPLLQSCGTDLFAMDIHEVEQLLLDCMGDDLVCGKIDEEENKFEVSWVRCQWTNRLLIAGSLRSFLGILMTRYSVLGTPNNIQPFSTS